MSNKITGTISAYLSATNLFGGLPSNFVSRLASTCRIKTFSKRSFLFYQDENGESAYLLIRGRIQLTRHTEAGKEIVIKTVKPGEFFAEVILFEIQSYPVTAEALIESSCIVVSRTAFRRLMDDPEFRDRFIGLLMERQRYLASRIQYLTMFDLEERFFRFLEDQYGDKREIRQVVAKKDMAAAIGTTPESLSRLVRDLTDKGRIKWEKNIIYRY